MEGHLKALMRRHSALDTKIAELSRRPSACSPSLARLKRMRLAVKDQLERHRAGSAAGMRHKLEPAGN